MKTNPIFKVAALVLASVLVFSGIAVAASTVWILDSAYDNYNRSDINQYYDINYLSAAEWDDDINAKNNLISFYINLKTPVTQNMFNDNQDSWAGLYFDYTGDGTDELKIEISDISFKDNLTSTSVWLNSSSAGAGIGKCGAVTYTNIASSVKWIGIKFDKVCAGLPNSFYVDAFIDYNANDDAGFDYNGDWFLTIPSTTATTTTTTTTVPKVQIPNAPSSVSISQLSETSLRITWLDNSTNEDGFLIQRNDTPVPSGTSSSAWPYKTATNTPSVEYAGLITNRSYCFSISSYNSAGSSAFTDSACINLIGAVPTTQPPASVASLSCDASRVSSAGKSVQIVVETGIANAGKAIKFEIYKGGDWVAIGTGRTSKTGVSALTAKINIVGKKGTFPIRGSQGSRFICEGSLT
jgi:hypothetical protein